MLKKLVCLALLASAACLCGCEREKNPDAPKSNILRDYVRTPVDRAKTVREQVEDRDREMQRQIEQVEDAEDR